MTDNKEIILQRLGELRDKYSKRHLRDDPKTFTINTDINTIEYEYKISLINQIKNLLETLSYPVHPKIFNPDTNIEEIKKVYDTLKDHEKHVTKEREFFKLYFFFCNTFDDKTQIPTDGELDKYCYGTKAYYDLHIKNIVP